MSMPLPLPYPPNIVTNGEPLFRRVKYPTGNKPEHYVREGGNLRVTAAAFFDSNGEISVNRAAYCVYGAHDLLDDVSDGVVVLQSSIVRTFPHNSFSADVLGTGFAGNYAHADMQLVPHASGGISNEERKALNKFCSYLKKVVGSNWAIIPPEPPPR